MGDRLHFKTGRQKPGMTYLMFLQTPCKISISETFHFKIIKTLLRYRLRANPLKSTFSPLFTTLKITHLTLKIPLNTYK